MYAYIMKGVKQDTKKHKNILILLKMLPYS